MLELGWVTSALSNGAALIYAPVCRTAHRAPTVASTPCWSMSARFSAPLLSSERPRFSAMSAIPPNRGADPHGAPSLELSLMIGTCRSAGGVGAAVAT